MGRDLVYFPVECKAALCRETIGKFPVHASCERKCRCIVGFCDSFHGDIALMDDVFSAFVDVWKRDACVAGFFREIEELFEVVRDCD